MTDFVIFDIYLSRFVKYIDKEPKTLINITKTDKILKEIVKIEIVVVILGVYTLYLAYFYSFFGNYLQMCCVTIWNNHLFINSWDRNVQISIRTWLVIKRWIQILQFMKKTIFVKFWNEILEWKLKNVFTFAKVPWFWHQKYQNFMIFHK